MDRNEAAMECACRCKRSRNASTTSEVARTCHARRSAACVASVDVVSLPSHTSRVSSLPSGPKEKKLPGCRRCVRARYRFKAEKRLVSPSHSSRMLDRDLRIVVTESTVGRFLHVHVVSWTNTTTRSSPGRVMDLAPNMADEAWVREVLEKTKVSADVERKRKDVLERLRKAVDHWVQRNQGGLVQRVAPSDEPNQQGNAVDSEGNVHGRCDGVSAKRRLEVVAFGSTVMGISTPQSDMDVSVVAPLCSWEDRGKVLKRIDRTMSSICRGTRKDVVLRSKARIPVLQYTDVIHKLHCDVTVSAGGSAFKSEAIGLLLSYDERAAALAKLVKLWAKAEGINDPSNGTFNSFSLVLLVIVYLQCQQPSVLPPLKEVLFSPNIPSLGTAREKRTTERCGNETTWSTLLQNIRTHRKAWKSQNGIERNQKLVSELLQEFFIFYNHSLSHYQPHMRACAYDGNIENTSLARNGPQVDVVDPFDEDENCARTIRRGACYRRIQKSFKAAASSITGDQKGSSGKICQANKSHVVDCLTRIANMQLEEHIKGDHAIAPARKKGNVRGKIQKAIPKSTQHDKHKKSEATSQPGQKLVAQHTAKKPKNKGTLVMVAQEDDSQLKSKQGNKKPPTHAEMYHCPFCPFSCNATDLPSRKRHKKETRHVWNRLIHLYKGYILQDEQSVTCTGCSRAKCTLESKKKILEFEKHVRLLYLCKGAKPQNWKSQCSVPHIREVEGQAACECILCAARIDVSSVCGVLALLQHTMPHEKIK